MIIRVNIRLIPFLLLLLWLFGKQIRLFSCHATVQLQLYTNLLLKVMPPSIPYTQKARQSYRSAYTQSNYFTQIS